MPTITEQLQRIRNKVANSFEIKSESPLSSLYIKAMDGKILAHKHHFPIEKQQEFINSVAKENPDIRWLKGERIQFPNDLNTSLAVQLEKEIDSLLSLSENRELYESHKLNEESFVYDVASNNYYPNDWSLLNEATQTFLITALPSEIDRIKDPSEKVQMAAVQKNPDAILHIENPSEEVQLATVRQNGNYIQTIPNPSDKVALAAVNQSGLFIEAIDNPSEKVQLAAVQQNGNAIKYIHNPTENVQLAAVQESAYAIQCLDDPSEKVLLAAVQKDPSILELIDNPSEQVQLAALQKDLNTFRFIGNPSESVLFSIVENNPEAIKYIHNPSEEIQMLAVKSNPAAIVHIYSSTAAVQLAAIQQDENVIKYIQNPTEEVQLAAVCKNGLAIEYIRNPSENVQLTAVCQNGNSITWIDNPSEQIQLAAVSQNRDSIKYIHNPSEEIQMAAKDIRKETTEQLSKLGIAPTDHERIINELLTAGKTNSLVTIRTSILNQEVNALARLSMNNDDAHGLKLHFIRHDIKSDLELPFMGHYFTDEQKQNLLTTKNAGEIIEIQGVNGKPQQVLVSVDRLTGELISQPVERVLIPEAFRGVSLSEADKQKLKTGQPLIIERVKASRGTEYSITVQYNADLRKVVPLANSNKITIVGGATLSEKDSESLRMGKTIQVSNLIDDKGEKYSAFVRLRYPKEDILITPTNAHKIQVSHNNHGEKTEQNKKLEKSEGQSPVKSGTTQAKRTKRKIK